MKRPIGILFGFISLALVALAPVIHADPGCCVGRVGDVNGEGGDEPTIADISRLVDRLFIHPESQLPCLAEADVNGSGYPVATPDDLSIGDIGLLVDYLFITGPSMVLLDCPDPPTGPYGYLHEMGECKTELATDGPGESCIQWSYLDGRLSLSHINAGFNCCPEMEFSVVVEGYNITITENEIAGLCDCHCLFDLSFVIDNLEPGFYVLNMIEPYADPDEVMPPIPLNLATEPVGLRCVPRTTYPWYEGDLSGQVIGNSGCKSMGGSAASVAASEETCIRYSYDLAAGRLSFTHVDGAFNCCPAELTAEFIVEGNTITVVEDEILDMGGCACLCLFDLSCVMTGVPAGQYQLVIDERYTAAGPLLELSLYLTQDIEDGFFCVPRDGYPWGEMY